MVTTDTGLTKYLSDVLAQMSGKHSHIKPAAGTVDYTFRLRIAANSQERAAQIG